MELDLDPYEFEQNKQYKMDFCSWGIINYDDMIYKNKKLLTDDFKSLTDDLNTNLDKIKNLFAQEAEAEAKEAKAEEEAKKTANPNSSQQGVVEPEPSRNPLLTPLNCAVACAVRSGGNKKKKTKTRK